MKRNQLYRNFLHEVQMESLYVSKDFQMVSKFIAVIKFAYQLLLWTTLTYAVAKNVVFMLYEIHKVATPKAFCKLVFFPQ